MPCYSPILPLFLIGILYVASSVSYSDCHYALNITNDGPATLDVPVTVSAQLKCADDKAEYLYEFEDDIHKTYRVLDHAEASASFIYTDHPAVRTVQVTAYLFSHPLFLVATGKTSFRIEDYIPGTLNFTGIVLDRNERKFLQTGSVTNISVQIHYPRLVLQESEFAYSWTIEEDHFTTDQSYKLHTFTDAGPHLIRVAVVGRIPFYPDKNGYRYKWGYFGDEITIKDPVVHINISGNTYLEHGQLLDLDISCNGSGPVDYCWKILPPTKNSSNFSCSDVVTSTECSFPILYYFRDSGDYQLAIHVNNLITSLEREIEVHIYDVSLRPELSTVIIPVVCSVLVVLIIATAVVLHMRRHSNYDIETADFDFMQVDESSAVIAETSWEVMRRSLLRLIQLRCLCYSSEGGSANVNYGTILVGVEK